MQTTEECEQFEDYMLSMRQLSPRSVKNYLDYYKTWQRFGGELTQERINEFISKYKGVLARYFLRMYLDWKQRVDLKVIKPTGRKTKMIKTFLTKEQVDLLVNYIYKRNAKHGLFFEVSFYGALRFSEAKGIRIPDFLYSVRNDGKPSLIKVKAKGRERQVPIPASVITTLKEYVGYIVDKGILMNEDDQIFGKLSKNYWNNLLRDSSMRLFGSTRVFDDEREKYKDIPLIQISSHTLRRSRASYLRQMGLSIEDLKTFMGHSNISTTMLYLTENKEEVIGRVSDLIKNE